MIFPVTRRCTTQMHRQGLIFFLEAAKVHTDVQSAGKIPALKKSSWKWPWLALALYDEVHDRKEHNDR
jgi:hypothetical protein